MRQRFGRLLIALCAAVLIAATSIVSAAQMTPAASASPEMAAFVAAGGNAADVCGDLAEMPHCPLCHAVADAPEIAFAPCARRAALGSEFPMRADLATGSQRKRSNVLARAPPERV